MISITDYTDEQVKLCVKMIRLIRNYIRNMALREVLGMNRDKVF